MLVPLLCIKDNSIGVILANHNQENWTRSTKSFSSHGLIIIPIIWSLILKANHIHFLFRKLPLQKNNSGIWHIYLLLTVPGHKFYLKNNILTISIHEKNAPKKIYTESLYYMEVLTWLRIFLLFCHSRWHPLLSLELPHLLLMQPALLLL